MCVYCCEIVRSYLLDITALLELETQAFRYTSDNICKTCVCDQYNLILGQVFDVEKGMKHYGPSGGNNFFTGGVPVRLADLLSQGLQAYGQTGGGSSTVKVESPERPCCRWRQPWRRGRHSRTKPRLRSNTSQPATQSGVLLGEDGSGAPPRVVERREARPAYRGYCLSWLGQCVSRTPPQ